MIQCETLSFSETKIDETIPIINLRFVTIRGIAGKETKMVVELFVMVMKIFFVKW